METNVVIEEQKGALKALKAKVDIKVLAEGVFDVLDIFMASRNDYKSRIGMFLEFLEGKELNFNSFLEFKRFLANRIDLSVSTKNKYLITARIFLKELSRRGILPTDITQNVKGFKQSHKHKRDGVNEEEIRELVEKLNSMSESEMNARKKAIFSLLILQGLRQIEVVRLDVADLDLVLGTALVQGKGEDDKERIYLHPETVRTLKEYLKLNKIADGALFVDNYHKNKVKVGELHTSNPSEDANYRRITTRAIRKMVKKIFKELGIEKTTHGFRHYFTTKLIKEYKGDLLEVAQYTRHKSLEMLQVYNDNVNREADLPRFYKTFEGIKLSESGFVGLKDKQD